MSRPYSAAELAEMGALANGDPACRACAGLGYTYPDLPVDDPKFGQLQTCACYATKRAAALRDRYFAGSNLAGLEGMNFDAFNTAMPGVRPAFDACQQFAAAPTGTLYLSGTYGCGKTHLAIAIALACLDRGVPVLFQTAPDFLRALRATFGTEAAGQYEAVFALAANIEVLVIDDLGAQKNSDWAAEQLFQLINHRYLRRLPTVITSNLTAAQIEQQSPRLASRLADSRVVEVTGADYRRLTAAQRLRRLP